MRGWLPIFKRELAGYFATPVAYVFIVIFLILTGVFTFEIGNFFGPEGQGQADLRPFFGFHPWLYLCLVPAVAMRLWAEERRGGTLELLMTLPVARAGAVVGKYLAAWVFCGLALALTFPMWVTVAWLGDPDHGAIATGYIGSFLLAGGFLAIGAAVSAGTRSQVIAFIVSVVICFGFLLAGYGPVINFFTGWAPAGVLEAISSFGFLTRFDGMAKGVIDLRDLIFFASLIAGCLVLNTALIEAGKGD
jgi:ABC-2 type transport system permease protein